MSTPVDAALRDALEQLAPPCDAARCEDPAYWITTLNSRLSTSVTPRFLLCDGHMTRLNLHMDAYPGDAALLTIDIEPVSEAAS